MTNISNPTTPTKQSKIEFSVHLLMLAALMPLTASLDFLCNQECHRTRFFCYALGFLTGFGFFAASTFPKILSLFFDEFGADPGRDMGIKKPDCRFDQKKLQ